MNPNEKFLVENLPLFAGLHDTEVEFYKDKFSLLSFSPDDIITNGSFFEQKACYFICSGKVRVIRSSMVTSDVTYYTLSSDMGFGYEHLLKKEPVHLTESSVVFALTHVNIFSVSEENFSKMLRDVRITNNFTRYVLEIYYTLLAPPMSENTIFKKVA